MNVKDANLKFTNELIPLDLHRVEFLFIHHIAYPLATVETIHQWHQENGWAGIGYNEYIRKDGTVYIARGDHVGVQVANYNSVSYGIGLEGNYDVEKTVPQAQMEALVKRCRYHLDRFPNEARVLPHNAFGKTDCPGKNFPMVRLYELIESEKKDNKLDEAKKFLHKYGEQDLSHEGLIYRMREIYQNAFESDVAVRETLKSLHGIGTETSELIYKLTKQQLRDLFKRRA